MKITIVKLGSMVGDFVSRTEGMLTHALLDLEMNIKYIYQPRGLNPETQQPVDRIWLERARIVGDIEEVEVELPVEVLGSKGTDIASGFKGTIVGIAYHINGCVHLEIKPKGVLKKTGATIDTYDVDIRRVKGPAITALTEIQLNESIAERPSPMGMLKSNPK